jgi:hypothetical protein
MSTRFEDVVIPCLYNSFSFTPENNSIVYYDTSNYRMRNVSEDTYTPTVAVSVPVVVPMDDTDDTDDADDTENKTTTPQPEFHPEIMERYVYNVLSSTTDSLLWAAYIMIHGTEKYETIENHYTEANRFKFVWIETLRKCKPILKANKIKISEVEESLVHKPFIHLETFRAIVVCSGMSACIVNDRKYYEIQGGSGSGSGSGSGGVVIEKIKGKYTLYVCSDEIKNKYLNFIRQNYWLMESISTPIRPISAYKLQDLVDISNRLGLPIAYVIPGKFGSMGTEKRKTKPELYEAIKLKVYL